MNQSVRRVVDGMRAPLFDAGRFQEAQIAAEKFLREEPGHAIALQLHGQCHLKLGQYEKAIVQLEAGRNDSAMPAELELSNWLALAMARHQLGQHEEAAHALDSAKSAQLEPGEGNVMGLIQRILLREAETVFANKGRTEP